MKNNKHNFKKPLQNITFNNNSNTPVNNTMEEEEDVKKLPENKTINIISNVSQSQEVNMEIEEIIKDTNLIGSLSTQESNHINISQDANKNINQLNCAFSCTLPEKKTEIFNAPEKKDPTPPPVGVIKIPVPNPIMKKLAIERKEMLKKKEKEIFQFNNLSEEEKIVFNIEYINELYSNLLEDENKTIPLFGYMERQSEINQIMRSILIDWLIDVHCKFNFKEETLYQTIFIIDAYCSKVHVKRFLYQLVGTAAFLIACKQNEIYCPELKKFIELTDNTYKKEELIEMENDILKVLCFDVRLPTANDFYNIVSKANNFNQNQYYLGKYILDSSLIDYQMLKYPPSVIGVSCVYFVMKFFGLENYKNLYSKDLVNDSFPEKVIKEAAKNICFFVKNLSQSNLQATKNKYSTTKYLNVAGLIEEQNNQQI